MSQPVEVPVQPAHLSVRVAGSADLPAVWRLTHDAYVAQGYCDPQPNGWLKHYTHLDHIPETTVLVAERGGKLLATLAFTLDNETHGLHVDRAFKDVVDVVRRQCRESGQTLGASWRIITERSARCSTDVLPALFDRFQIHLEMHGIDRVLVSFNPKHERVWSSLIGFSTIAGPRPDPSVNGAPAVLMIGYVPDMIMHWKHKNG